MCLTVSTRSQGVEFGLSGRLLPGLNIFSGYTYLDIEDSQIDTNPAIIGNELANVPTHSANVWVTYDFLEKWQIGGGPTYVGCRLQQCRQTIARVPDHVRWDSTVAYQLNKNIPIAGQRDQSDQRPLLFDSLSGDTSLPGAGRTFIGSASFKF